MLQVKIENEVQVVEAIVEKEDFQVQADLCESPKKKENIPVMPKSSRKPRNQS